MAQATNVEKRFYWSLAGVFGGGILLAAVIFLVVLPLVEYAGKPAYLDVLVEPSAKVEINGQEYENAVYKMEPGSYMATVQLGDLPAEEISFELAKNQTTGIYMEWTGSGGWRYFTAEELKHKNSIGEVMPIYASVCGTPAKRTNCNAIVINYDRAPQCGGQQCLVINGREAKMGDDVLSLVREELARRGYNLDDYRYVYAQNDDR